MTGRAGGWAAGHQLLAGIHSWQRMKLYHFGHAYTYMQLSWWA